MNAIAAEVSPNFAAHNSRGTARLRSSACSDRITDFNAASDTILVWQMTFLSLGVCTLPGGQFVIGTAAQDANDHIIYDSASGARYYDSDGAGGNAQIQFADVGRDLALTNLDFFVTNLIAVPPPDRDPRGAATAHVRDQGSIFNLATDDGTAGLHVIDPANLRIGTDLSHLI